MGGKSLKRKWTAEAVEKAIKRLEEQLRKRKPEEPEGSPLEEVFG